MWNRIIQLFICIMESLPQTSRPSDGCDRPTLNSIESTFPSNLLLILSYTLNICTNTCILKSLVRFVIFGKSLSFHEDLLSSLDTRRISKRCLLCIQRISSNFCGPCLNLLSGMTKYYLLNFYPFHFLNLIKSKHLELKVYLLIRLNLHSFPLSLQIHIFMPINF